MTDNNQIVKDLEALALTPPTPQSTHVYEGLNGKSEPEPAKSYDFRDPHDCFEFLYEICPSEKAKQASRKERQENQFISTTLVYGEICFGPFSALLQHLKTQHKALPATGGVFVDIGSGSGRAVFSAALTHDFDLCIGLEILQNLHALSQQVLQRWRQKLVKHLESPLKKRTRFNFLYSDACGVNWKDADLVFANSTCFDEQLMERIAKSCAQLRSGVIVVTATKRLPSDEFQVLERCSLQETWGEATIFIQQRI